MVNRVNIVITIGIILKIIINWLELPIVPIIVYTNLYSLYKYLVKLSTTKEKHLIINIIALQQSYKRQKLFKIQ
jgi:phosphate/sulfate permease